MAGSSYPFNAGTGATITETQWSNLTKDYLGRGIHEAGTVGPRSALLQITTDLTPNTVWLQPGRATIDGFHFELSAFVGLTVTTNTNTTLDRIDLVVLALDLAGDKIDAVVKAGTPSATPVAPSVGANELPLASFYVRKNALVVQDLDITDLRTFIGRRYLVAEATASLPEGSLSYKPTTQTWHGTKQSTNERLAYKSEVDANLPAYSSTGLGTFQPNVTMYEHNLNAVHLPGGRKIVHWYFYGKYNGVTASGTDVQIGQLPSGYIPAYLHRFVGHQFIFSNSTDDIPLILRLNTDGRYYSGGVTWMQGGAQILFNTTYIV